MGDKMESSQSSPQTSVSDLGHVFAVASGKGGVGKSTIAASLAYGLQYRGARVGLMDADVYGPSIPHLLGARGRPAASEENGQPRIAPIEQDGLKLMSMGFLIEEGRAAIWRGPMLHGMMQQFLRNVVWGKLDYLVVDLPPTTGDVPLSLSQLFPLTGAVIVCTPQDVALIDAIRAINMFRQLRVPILGLVENMSHFDCPHCGGRSEIFGHGGARAAAERENIPFLGEVPINLQARINGDRGQLKENFAADNPIRPYLLNITEQLVQRIEQQAQSMPQMPTVKIG
jgi:ATP-binding protein involved in chromosome partitioning